MVTTDDAFLGGALRLLQPRSGYRAGLDAVLLAAAVPAKASDLVLDAGAGVGTVGLCLARRVAVGGLALIEMEPTLAALARQNAERNGLGHLARVIEADVAGGGAAFAERLEPQGFKPGAFAHVAANPPYHDAARGTASPDGLKARSHAMAEGDLDGWLRFLATACARGGTATVIHDAAALPALLAAMAPRFGALRIVALHSRADQSARRIIVQGVKGSRAPLSVRPGLVIHGDDNRVRPEIEAILRHGAPLAI